MYQAAQVHSRNDYPHAFAANDPVDYGAIACEWEPLRKQLLAQWNRLTEPELDEAGPNRRRLAMLIEHKSGVDRRLAENYLRNFERTLPLS